MNHLRTNALLACTTTLLSALLAGCGVTSNSIPQALSPGSSASTASAPLGPQLGYLWIASQNNLYPMLGVAGATHFGAALLSTAYVAGAVGGSGSGTVALLVDKTGTLDKLKLATMTISVVSTGVPADARLAFAPAGSYAVVFSPSGHMALLLSGLQGVATPQVTELTTPAGTLLVGAAVSDAGNVLAGWTSAGSAGVSIGTLGAGGANILGSVTAWGGAGFVPSAATSSAAASQSSAQGGMQDQAILADAGTGLLTRVSGIGGAAPATTPLTTGGLLQTSAGVAISHSGRWVFAADSAKQQVVRVDLTGATPPSSLACSCQPARLLPLAGNTLFAVSADLAAQPAWLLDASTATQRTFFVPAFVPALATSSAASTASQTAASPVSQASSQIASEHSAAKAQGTR